MQISDLITPSHVVLDLVAQTKPRLLQLMAQRAALDLGLDPATILAALDRREALGSTGIGRGVALPHTSLAELPVPYALLCRLARPLDFDAIDDHPVDLAVLLLTPDDPPTHLKALSIISRQLRADPVLAKIRKAKTAAAICDAMVG